MDKYLMDKPMAEKAVMFIGVVGSLLAVMGGVHPFCQIDISGNKENIYYIINHGKIKAGAIVAILALVCIVFILMEKYKVVLITAAVALFKTMYDLHNFKTNNDYFIHVDLGFLVITVGLFMVICSAVLAIVKKVGSEKISKY